MDNLNQIIPTQLSSPTALRKRIRLIVYILITTLCAGQFYSISIDYLYGEITTKVNLFMPERIVLPTVSLCFPFLDLINLTKADHRFDNFSYLLKNRPSYHDHGKINDIYTEIYSILSNLTIREINDLLEDIEHVTPIVALTPIYHTNDPIRGHHLVNANSSCEINYYVSQPSFCLTIRCVNEKNKPLEYKREDIFQQPYNGEMLYIQMNPNASTLASSVSLVFTANNDMIHGKKQSGYRIGLNNNISETHIVTYTKITNFLIPDSVEVSCFNYSLIGYSSKAAYLDACLNNASSLMTGTVFYGTVQEYNDINDLMSGFHQFYHEYLNPNVTERKKKRSFYKYCRKYCYSQANKPDCHQEILYPVGFRKIPRSDKICEIIVRAPTSPFETNRYYPEYTLLDLLIYFASSLNFWFGLSLVSLSERFLDFYWNLFTREKRSQRQKSDSKLTLPKGSSRSIEIFAVQTRKTKVTKMKNIPNEMPDVYY